MSAAVLTYRETLDAIDAAADLHRTCKAVLKAVCAVAIGPRSRSGRVVAYSVLGHLAACSERTVARAVELLEARGLVRRLRCLPDARAGYGYGYAIDPAAVAALTPRMGFLERCAQRRAERLAARERARCVAAYPSDKLTDTESGQQEKQNNKNNSARASAAPDPFAVDPFAADPFAADPLEHPADLERVFGADEETKPAKIEPSRGLMFTMQHAAAAARAVVAQAFKRGPSPSPPSTPSGDPEPPRKPQAASPSAPSTSNTSELDAIRTAHSGSPARLEEIAVLVERFGEQHVVRAWSHALEHAKYQPPRPAYLRAWLENPENIAVKPASRPAAKQGPSVYCPAHADFPKRVEQPPESEEDHARGLDRFAAMDEELK
jgi:hypothetical protein